MFWLALRVRNESGAIEGEGAPAYEARGHAIGWIGRVFLQASDCSGNLAQVRPLLTALALDTTLRIELVDVSRDGQVETLARSLPRELRRFPIRRIARDDRKLLEALEYSESPVTLLMDPRGRVRMVLTSESDPSLHVAASRAALHLLLGDSSP